MPFRRASRSRRFLAVGPLVLLLSLAPSVLYLDHWSEYFGLALVREESPLEHIGHCHISPASCSDQPLPPNPGAAPAVVVVVEPELTSIALEDAQSVPKGHAFAPLTEPPRA